MKTTAKKIIIARASHVLVSPRKTNLLLKALVGRNASLAIKQLAIIPKRASDPIAKIIRQGIGNAVSQHNLSPDSLIIDSAFATKGRVLKRAHVGGRSRTKPYQKTTSHVTINLSSKELSLPAPKKETPVKVEAKTAKKETPVTKAKTTKTKK